MLTRGVLNNGVTLEELQEFLLHARIYGGAPSAVDVCRSAAEEVNALKTTRNH